MSASAAAAALAALTDDAPAWLPAVDHWEIARDGDRWKVSGQLDTADGSLGEADANRLLSPVADHFETPLGDDGRLIRAEFTHFGTPVSIWFLRPVLRWLVPEQCATCPTKLGDPGVAYVRLGDGSREAPVICVECRDRMHAAWVLTQRAPLVAARRAASEVLLADTGEQRPLWRACFTELDGGEYPNAIAPVCTNDEHDGDDPTVYDCCPDTVVEVESHKLGAYLVELLNADAEAPLLFVPSQRHGGAE
ncbi:hypothetical protein AAIB46_10065 [Streptomyces sp. 35M1]|uniref:hypothetical protein n=1 Tax=Streptomyces sp. 35M1 TaxID=3142978 RepID=UPI003990B9C3